MLRISEIWHFWCCFLLLFLPTLLGGQTVLNPFRSQDLFLSEITIDEALSTLQEQSGVTLSYNPSKFDGSKLLIPPSDGEKSLQDWLKYIFKDYAITIEFMSQEKLLLLINPRVNLVLSGYVRSEKTGELINGAIIQDVETGKIAMSNEQGFYRIGLTSGLTKLAISNLGYETNEIMVDRQVSGNLDIRLKFNNELEAIVITANSSLSFLQDPGSTPVDRVGKIQNVNVFGEADVFSFLATQPGVHTGGEGQSGVSIRGSANDQNLVLLDGMPLYESSHTAGISSIFIDESVQNVDFFKAGLPARYSGRIGGAVNVRLKEGSVEKRETTLGLNTFGMKVHLNGPIGKGKTTYALSGRYSWIEELIRPAVKKYTAYDDIALRFRDGVAKITHRFSEQSKLSGTFYVGGDRLRLDKTIVQREANSVFTNFESNRLQWGNLLGSINFEQVLGAQFKLNAQFGLLNYRYTSRGVFNFVSEQGPIRERDFFDIVSFAQIKDRQAVVDLDYYLSDDVKLKIGAGHIAHRFLPTVRQSLIEIDEESLSFADEDSVIRAANSFVFAEWNIKLGENIFIYPGIHLSRFGVRDTTYWSPQPRIRMIYQVTKSLLLKASASQSTQFTHLLANPGLGLPSDLWVPSTRTIRPQEDLHYSLEADFSLPKFWSMHFGGFYRRQSNLLEYVAPVDLFASLIDGTNPVPIFTSQSEWERQVVNGSGRIRGLEFSIRKDGGAIRPWLSYTYTSAKRTFATLNKGLPFPSRQDRPHSINLGSTIRLSHKSQLMIQWVFVSGTPFSLATEEFDSFLGIRLLRPDGRNNYRLPDFHQLSLNYLKNFSVGSLDGRLTLGVYNAYNRLNAYYVYAARNQITGDVSFRKVSIFPFVPNVGVQFSW